jgi:hypothetical protein
MSDNALQLSPRDVEWLLAQNTEMRRLLDEYQWSGLTPTKSRGICPDCCGSGRNGHRPGCAIEAALDAPLLPD